jgi:hypothetical protein
MRFRDYVRLLRRHRFRIHPFRWAMAMILVPCTMINSVLYRLQQWKYGKKLSDVQIQQPPVFIVGHWRSGTTYLHELIVRDERFTYPTTYECFAPHHFVISEWIMPRLLGFLLPQKRPMDNMAAGFERPQEDEFALCAMGAPTPYVRMAFPNEPAAYSEFIDMQGVRDEDLQRFTDAMSRFIRALTLQREKPVVLKSPPHTGRIGLLSKMFPGAKFIHIVRHPYDLFPSTRRTWQALDTAQAFQVPHFRELDEYILDSLVRMYRGFEQQRAEIDPDLICDVRYEELVQDPVGQLAAIYKKLELGDFERVRGRIEEFVDGQRAYQVNRHELEPEIKAQIDQRWAGYMEKYGYSTSEARVA